MKLITSILALTVLTACATTPEIVPIEPVKTTITIAPAPKPSPISLKPVEFRVITDKTKQSLDSERVWYAITVKSYENLAYNTQELLRVIREQNAAITYYEGLYIGSN
jgi:uncharacterized lipoprotein YajG